MSKYVIRRVNKLNGISFLYRSKHDNKPYIWMRRKDAEEMATLLNDYSDDHCYDYENKVETL
jgi:hypothetical protein